MISISNPTAQVQKVWSGSCILYAGSFCYGVAEGEQRLSVVEELESVVSANLKRANRLRQSTLQRPSPETSSN